MSDDLTPLLSVILVTPNTYRRVRKTIQSLQKQSARGQLEIVIATPSRDLADALPEDWKCFRNVKVVSTGPFRNTGHPRAVAVSHASSDVVAFAEDHCFPQAGWAECIGGLRHLPWAAISPALENENPSPVSWADFLLNFGPAVAPTNARTTDYTPWHNTAYKRELLREYGEKLEHMLEVEIRLQQDLVQRGHQCYLAAETRARHINISRLRSFVYGPFVGGRIYSAGRAEAFHWNIWKRLLYSAGSPLIPLVRFPRVLGDAQRTKPAGDNTWNNAWDNARFWIACAAGLAASAGGEAVGYLAGAGGAGRDRISFEFERHLHVRKSDLALLDPE
jgi:hypothetical protein